MGRGAFHSALAEDGEERERPTRRSALYRTPATARSTSFADRRVDGVDRDKVRGEHDLRRDSAGDFEGGRPALGTADSESKVEPREQDLPPSSAGLRSWRGLAFGSDGAEPLLAFAGIGL